MKFTERQLQVDLELAGGQMANILFNVAQRDGEMLSPNVIASMDAARRSWDLALGRVRQAKHLTGASAPSTTLNIDQVRKDFQEGTLICRATIGLMIDALSAAAVPAVELVQASAGPRQHDAIHKLIDAASLPKYEYSDKTVTLTNPEDRPSYATVAKMPNGATAANVYEAWDKALEEAAKVAETVRIQTYAVSSYATQVLCARETIAEAIRALKTGEGDNHG